MALVKMRHEDSETARDMPSKKRRGTLKRAMCPTTRREVIYPPMETGFPEVDDYRKTAAFSYPARLPFRAR
ncbi:hypothetical protein GCM10007863_32930 [Dyella mobilis]|nr:hypothetical protein GCM10007863_32930 [Dyella mobilis]